MRPETEAATLRSSARSRAGRRHAVGLSILLALFVLRVSAQLIQLLRPTPLLPPFEAWQSGTVPYGVLVVAQALIIAAVVVVIVRLACCHWLPRRNLGIALLALGAIYMGGAAFRLLAGMSFLSHLSFFRALLPSLFHMVLAGIVITIGHFHFRGSARGQLEGSRAATSRLVGRIAYPCVMLLAIAALWSVFRAGTSLFWAPYAAVASSALAIAVIERLLPYRTTWNPTAADLTDDGAFLIVVQVLLPLALSWIAVWLAQRLLFEHGLVFAIWPTHSPIWAQVLLKLSVGDLFRYWLHRWAHEHPILWRIHAVHHFPRKLYSANVFRFHPADKALQFLCDSLPFILLGVGPTVLAYYFVVYATSGLFQHSNCDLRLGWLNYLVSGPEVHRWHHSRELEESNHNYAHTFVVWDLLFGTYYRPLGAAVDRLGLLEENYPARFGEQLLAPFAASPSGTNAASS